MKALLQRVKSASVTVNGQVVGSIDQGILLLVGFGKDDNVTRLKPLAEKVVNMRLFADEHGKFNLSLREVHGGVLVVPQFTLYADTSKGRRPEFFGAMDPHRARPLFKELVEAFKGQGTVNVQTGEFGAHMSVKLENDGPVTIMLES